MEKEFSPMEAFTCKVIFLKDEMGNNIKFEYMDLIQHVTGQYAVLRQIDTQGTGEVEDAIVILKVEKDESDPEMESYVGVESEEILREVFGQFLEKMKAEEKV